MHHIKNIILTITHSYVYEVFSIKLVIRLRTIILPILICLYIIQIFANARRIKNL